MMKKKTGRNKLPFNVTFNFYALFMSGNSLSVCDGGHTVSLHNIARITSAKALSRCLRRAMGNSDKSPRRKKQTGRFAMSQYMRDVPIKDNFFSVV